jgi:hypothetical protein
MPRQSRAHTSSDRTPSMQGKLKVDASGALDYRIGLTVPPGTAGMQPDLFLQYNSRFENGTVGVGWRLRGLSAVTRLGRTAAVDGGWS